jgi:hypothetical protein
MILGGVGGSVIAKSTWVEEEKDIAPHDAALFSHLAQERKYLKKRRIIENKQETEI